MANAFVVDSKGRCFLCLEQAKVSSNFKSKWSQDPTSYSLQCLFRYLEMDKGKGERVINNVELLERMKRSSIRASFCERCASLYGTFSELYQELELIEMKVGSYLKLIHEQLLETVKSDMAKKFRKSSGVDFWKGHYEGMDIADSLRIDVLRTCSLKLSNLSPRVHVQKMTPNEVDEKRRSCLGSASVTAEVSNIKLEVRNYDENSFLDSFTQPLEHDKNDETINAVRRKIGRPPKIHSPLVCTSVAKIAKLDQQSISFGVGTTRFCKTSTSQHATLAKMKKDYFNQNKAVGKQVEPQSLLDKSGSLDDKDNGNGSTAILGSSTKMSDQEKTCIVLDSEIKREIHDEYLHEAENNVGVNETEARLGVIENDEDYVEANMEVESEGEEYTLELERNERNHSKYVKCSNCDEHFTTGALRHHQKTCKAKVESEARIETIASSDLIGDDYEGRNDTDDDWDRQSDDSYHPPTSPLSTDGNESETELKSPVPKKSSAKPSVKRMKDHGNSTGKKSFVAEESAGSFQNATRADKDKAERPKKSSQSSPIKRKRPGSGNTKKLPWTRHPETGHYTCNLCSEEFNHYSKFHGHYKSIHLGIRYLCEFCDKELLSKQSYRVHLDSVHKGVTFKCDKCSAEFTQKGNLRNHQKKMKNCQVLKFSVKELAARRMHRYVDPKTGTVKCTLCSKVYKQARGFRRHYRGVHWKCPCPGNVDVSPETAETEDKQNESESEASNSVSATIPAEVSGTVFPQKPISQEHGVLNLQTGRIQCRHCSKEFLKAAFAAHYRSAHVNQRFKCIPCGKSYRCRHSLKVHYEDFHQAANLTCDKCGESFARRREWKHHLDTTACGEGQRLARKRPCVECGKVFATKGGLKTHMKFVHWKKLDHVCDICGKGFVYRGDFRRHSKKLHNVDIDDGKAPVEEGPATTLMPEEDGTFTLDNDPVHVVIPKERLAHTVVVREPTGNEPPPEPSYVEVLPDVLPEGVPPIGAIVDPVTGKFKCNACPLEFLHDSTYQIHYKGVHLKLKYKCTLCDNTQPLFAYMGTLNRHHQSVHLGIRHQCECCKRLFNYKGGLREHLKDTSCGVGKAPKKVTGDHVCHHCGQSYVVATSLKAHIEFAHLGIEFMCDICGKGGYRGASNLRSHKIQVHNISPKDLL